MSSVLARAVYASRIANANFKTQPKLTKPNEEDEYAKPAPNYEVEYIAIAAENHRLKIQIYRLETQLARIREQRREDPMYGLNKPRPKVVDIIKAVALEFEVGITDIIGPGRTQRIVRPRQVAMYLCKTLTMLSTTQISRAFDGRDHTTVIHAYDKISTKRKDNPELDARITALATQLINDADAYPQACTASLEPAVSLTPSSTAAGSLISEAL